MIELHCPESCPYLIDARTHAVQREIELQESAQDPHDLMLNDAASLIVDAIAGAIVSAHRSMGAEGAFHGLDDSDVLSAVEITIKNLETEESGLIYEHRADTHRIDELSRQIREYIEKIGEDVPAESRPRRSDILKGLNFTRNAVRVHISRARNEPESSRSFIRFTTLFYPWPPEIASPIIL